MKIILLLLLFVFISNSSNDPNKKKEKENEFHNKLYECIINSKNLTKELKTNLEENKNKLIEKGLSMRLGRVLPKFDKLDEKDQKIIIECRKNITSNFEDKK